MEIAIALALASFRMATPILFASLGGLFSERAGVINIALEGFMLVGAVTGAVVTLHTGSPYLGFAAAMAAGTAYSSIYALFTLFFRCDQVVASMAMNFLAMGAIPIALKVLYGSTSATPQIPIEQRFTQFPLWFVWAVLLAVHLGMHKTIAGLWISFAGEAPKSLTTAGVSVRKVRMLAVLASGALAGAGGATLSLCLASGYSNSMVAGRGFIALAALIFGSWRPIPAAAACLLFGFVDAIQIQLQNAEFLPWPLPVQLIQVFPYVVTLLVLAGFVGKSRAPSAIGK